MTDTSNQISVSEQLSNLISRSLPLLEKEGTKAVNALRNISFNTFKKLGVPTRKNEEYKYTDLTNAFSIDYRIIPTYEKQKVDLHELFHCDVPEMDTNIVLTINGWYYARNKELVNLPEGVTICNLYEASERFPELFEKYYGKIIQEDEPIAAINTTLATSGIFVHVDKNIVLEKPIQIINLMAGDQNTMANQRNLVIMEANSEAKIVCCDHTLSSANFIMNNLTEVVVRDNAKLDIYNVQNQHNNCVNLNSMFIDQHQDSHVLTHAITLHGGLVRNHLNIQLNGSNAEAEAYGLVFADQKQHVDNFTSIEHNVPRCNSTQIYKNIMDGEAKGAFTGKIHVKRNASKTEAAQSNNNLLLTPTAQMKAKPQLIIDNDDVKCSHGTTVGQIDQEALFYLQSRGISLSEAQLMMVFAFAHEVLSKVRIEPLRERIDEQMDRRVHGEVSNCESCSVACNKE